MSSNERRTSIRKTIDLTAGSADESNDISVNISERFYKMFDCIGCTMASYRPGVRCCSRCRINADQLYSPP